MFSVACLEIVRRRASGRHAALGSNGGRRLTSGALLATCRPVGEEATQLATRFLVSRRNCSESEQTVLRVQTNVLADGTKPAASMRDSGSRHLGRRRRSRMTSDARSTRESSKQYYLHGSNKQLPKVFCHVSLAQATKMIAQGFLPASKRP